MNILRKKDKDGSPIEKNGKPVWRLRWETRNPGDGGRNFVYETLNGTRREAERHWIHREAEIRNAGAAFVRPAKETLAEYLTRWLRDYGEEHLKGTTLESYRTLVRVHITPALGAVPLARLTAAQVQAWQADMLRKETPTGKPISPRRVAYARAVLRSALHEAVRLGMIQQNPVDRVRPPRQSPKEVTAFNLPQARALMEAARGHRLEAMLAVAWQTGMRLGELLAVTWADVDFEDRTLRIRQNLVDVDGELVFQEPKTEKGKRTLPMSAALLADLRAHRKRQLEERLRAGSSWEDNDLIFCKQSGKPLPPRDAQEVWYRLRNKADLPKYGFHSLRHTYATLALQAGVGLAEVSANLGHVSPAFTAKQYIHVLPEMRRAAADRFAAFLEGSS